MTKEIRDLVRKVDELKLFRFGKDQIRFRLDPLLELEIIEQTGDQIKVLETSQFTNLLFEFYAKKQGFALTEDFQNTISFYKKVRDEFRNEGKVILGITEQMSHFLGLLITKANQEFAENFEAFALGLHKSDDDKFLYELNKAFSISLYQLQIKPGKLKRILIHLIEEVSENVQFNMNLGELTAGIRKFSSSNPKEGKALFKLIEKNPVFSLNVSVLLGLYEKNPTKELIRLQELSKRDDYSVIIAGVIAGATIDNNKQAVELLKILDGIKSKEGLYFINLPRVYVGVINNPNLTSKALKAKAYKKLKWLLTLDDDTKRATVWEMQFIKDDDENIFEVINVMNNEKLDKAFCSSIAQVLDNFSDVAFFFEFLKGYAVNNPYQFNASWFDFPIYKYENSNLTKFSYQLIKLIIDDNGAVRFVGKRILSHMNGNNNGFQFGIDILDLPQLDQIKLWVSLFQENPEPKRILPLLISLRNSKYPLVVESFLCKIEELVESYSYSVIEELKELLDLRDGYNKSIMDRIALKYEEFKENWDRKAKIKELNPGYTQSKISRIFNENYYEKFSEQLDESVHENSVFLNLVTNVTLAKGGGWKHGENKQISELSAVSSSFQLPRNYYISPEKFDWQNRVYYTENWKNEFKEWEAIISSSENT
ncbi:MAG: hypothetical protein ABJH72_24610 [Reichenbachiella sp.]|uniref:hypothetical protein n=1 Tax=Reichenbachiella sp. TaxID=2184521 RepID=UPI003265BD6C